jgi:hypothetical protein
MQLPPSKPNPELDALIERAKNHVMTKAERDAKLKSWIIGETMLAHPEMTREAAERLYQRVIGD